MGTCEKLQCIHEFFKCILLMSPRKVILATATLSRMGEVICPAGDPY